MVLGSLLPPQRHGNWHTYPAAPEIILWYACVSLKPHKILLKCKQTFFPLSLRSLFSASLLPITAVLPAPSSLPCSCPPLSCIFATVRAGPESGITPGWGLYLPLSRYLSGFPNIAIQGIPNANAWQ